VHGREDNSTPVEEAYVVEKEIPGAEVIWIENANHFFKGVENDMVNAVVSWLKKKLN
jgi:alpha/beta superfamily hydrolase